MIKNGILYCDFCEQEMGKALEIKEYPDGIFCSDECRYEFETGHPGEEY
jgi:hypothetical protein